MHAQRLGWPFRARRDELSLPLDVDASLAMLFASLSLEGPLETSLPSHTRAQIHSPATAGPVGFPAAAAPRPFHRSTSTCLLMSLSKQDDSSKSRGPFWSGCKAHQPQLPDKRPPRRSRATADNLDALLTTYWQGTQIDYTPPRSGTRVLQATEGDPRADGRGAPLYRTRPRATVDYGLQRHPLTISSKSARSVRR